MSQHKLKNILVVDDEVIICDLIADILSMSGHIITKCNSGNEAVKILTQKKFDLIISDMRMDNGDGISILDYLNQNDYKTPIIFMTGYSSVTDKEAIELGAQTVIHKPFDIDVFLKIVSTH